MKYSIILFIILAIAQLFVPLSMIVAKQSTLDSGKNFKFITEPVDPTHPFKGKYLTLRFEEETYTTVQNKNMQVGDDVYVVIRDSVGFALVDSFSFTEPEHALHYFSARLLYSEKIDGIEVIHFEFPFDEFYLTEFDAPKAEELYAKSQADTTTVTYAVVAVNNGDAVLRDLFVSGSSLTDLFSKD